jgi:hypothetical protein
MAQITLNSSGVASNGALALQSNGTTTAVTIDASQNVGVGVTPSAWGTGYKVLQIGAAGALWSPTTASSQVLLNSNSYFDGTNYKYINTNSATDYFQNAGTHVWRRAASGTAGNTISFTQAMTLDASGNLLVGKTSFSGLSGTGAFVASDGRINVVNAASTNVFTTYELYSTGAGAYRFYVDAAGTIYATSATITPITSDERLKQNIVDYSNGLSQVLGLRPRYFEYKKEPGRKLAGFISQEVQTVMPDAIVPTREDPEMMTYSIDWYPMLVKAIQEQQALITQLQADVAAIKGASA